MSQPRFEGQGFVVTGGTQGIGRAVVLEAVRQKARVVCCGLPGSEAAGAQVVAAAASEDMAERVLFVPADLSRESEVERLFDIALDWLPAFQVLVHSMENTAGLQAKPLLETSLADWNKALALNVREPFWLSRRAIVEFLAIGEGGRIVHILPALAGKTKDPASFAASQSALHSLIRSITKEYGQRGIACNGVVHQRDGASTTLASMGCAELLSETMRWPALRPGQSEAAAEVVLFLASQEASFVNGELLDLLSGADDSPVSS